MAKNTNFNAMRDILLMTQSTTVNNEADVPAPDPAQKPAAKEEQKVHTKESQVKEKPEEPVKAPKIEEEKVTEAPVQDSAQTIATEEQPKEEKHTESQSVQDEVIPSKESKEEENLAIQKTDESKLAEQSQAKGEFYLMPSSLAGRNDLIQCGFVISRKNRFFLKKAAIQNGVNLNTIIATVLNDQYNISTVLSDDQVMKIEDEYYYSQRTNVKMTFIIPKFLKDFLNITAAECGLKISTMVNYFINLKREEMES